MTKTSQNTVKMGPWWRPSLHFSCFKSPCLRRNGDQASGKTMPPFSHLPTTSCRSFKETKMVIIHRFTIDFPYIYNISTSSPINHSFLGEKYPILTIMIWGLPGFSSADFPIYRHGPWIVRWRFWPKQPEHWKMTTKKSLQFICLENHLKKQLFMSESPWFTVGSQVFMKSPVFPTWILSTTDQTLDPGSFTPKKNMVASSCWLCGVGFRRSFCPHYTSVYLS